MRRHAHGVEWTDDFNWLRADNWLDCIDNPQLLPADIKSYLDAENQWFETSMADTQRLQDLLVDEMRGRILADDESLPDEVGPWAYIERYMGDDEHPRYLRHSRHSPDQPDQPEQPEQSDQPDQSEQSEQLLIDFNVQAEGFDYFSPGDVEHSPDHEYLLWSADTQGAERYTAFVRNLASGLDEDVIADVDSITWGDERHLFYTRVDKDLRPSQVLRHELGTDAASDAVVFEEADSRFFCSVWTSLSARYVFISSEMNDQSEVWLIDCSQILAQPLLIEPRTEGLEYSVEHQQDRFLILTNADGAADFKIMQTSCTHPSREHWRDWLPYQAGRMVLDVYAYKHWVMWIERENALPQLCYKQTLDGNDDGHSVVHRIDFSENAYALSLEPLLEYDERSFRFGYESPSTPPQTYLFSMPSGERQLLKQDEIPSGHCPSDYCVRRFQATSVDGEQVPVTLLYHSTTAIDGSAPCWLTGYGAYGSSMPADFSSTVLSLVDRGFVYAIAHVRGGQEKGRAWYEAARLGGKHNSIDDLIAVARYLVEQHYCTAGRIVLAGGSAGGLLVGAALNRDTELWGGAVADVPFVDVLNTLLDESLPLTPGEWSQWGNPIEDAQAFQAIRSYSPYDNVQPRAYPPMLVTAGISDPRVTYWEPAKWVARHRQLREDDSLLLLKTNMQSGHFGESGRYASLKEYAIEQAFALKIMGCPAYKSNRPLS